MCNEQCAMSNVQSVGEDLHAMEIVPEDIAEMAYQSAPTALRLTKNEAYSLAEFIDMNLIQFIRNDPDIDSLQWLRNMVHAYEALCAYSGFVGLTDDKEAAGEN